MNDFKPASKYRWIHRHINTSNITIPYNLMLVWSVTEKRLWSVTDKRLWSVTRKYESDLKSEKTTLQTETFKLYYKKFIGLCSKTYAL